VRTVQVAAQESHHMNYGNMRQIFFFDNNGKEIPEYTHHSDGTPRRSRIVTFQPCLPADWPGGFFHVPEGQQIIGFCILTNSEGDITSIDLKTWKPPTKA
jgi:hypothetical protein